MKYGNSIVLGGLFLAIVGMLFCGFILSTTPEGDAHFEPCADPAEAPPRVCDFEIGIDMRPPSVEGMNQFYTYIRGDMAHSKLYAHCFYYEFGGKTSVKHTGLGFECPSVTPFGLEHDAPGDTITLYCEFRCTECGHISRACIERPVVK